MITLHVKNGQKTMLLRTPAQWICDVMRLIMDRFIGSIPYFSNSTKSIPAILCNGMTPKKRNPVTIFRYEELNIVLKSSLISSEDFSIDIERFSNSKTDLISMLARCNVHCSFFELRNNFIRKKQLTKRYCLQISCYKPRTSIQIALLV
jgi:hypothetical protein